MTDVGDSMIVLASVALGIFYTAGYGTFDGIMIWLAVYAVFMLVRINQRVGDN